MITDGRFFGGTTGLRVGDTAPEAADGGPIAFVRDGDAITLDLLNGSLQVEVDVDEPERGRRASEHRCRRASAPLSLASTPKLLQSAVHGAVTG